MKYYYPEYIHGYTRIDKKGKTVFDEMFGAQTVENFSARDFLSAVIPTLQFKTSHPTVLNYGCGTGPDACFLAEHGFQVEAIDIIPNAIEIAKGEAAQRHLDIKFSVQDILQLPEKGLQYDMIVDSYCLQGFVFDEERRKLFSIVRNRLKSGSYYLVSSVIMDEAHRVKIHAGETVTDYKSGVVYTRYFDDKSGLIDLNTSSVWIPINHPILGKGYTGKLTDYPEAKQINDNWYLPYRRHFPPVQLKAELEGEGFSVIYQFPAHEGEMVCVKKKP
jgi:SAM-dependent methyltransferase